MNRYFLLIILTLVFGCSARETNVQLAIIRIIDEPIIPPILLDEIGENSKNYLLYPILGENGIGIVEFSSKIS